MGGMITFKRPDGQLCPAYLASAMAGANAPGVVLLPEWWGLRDQIKGVADRLAQEGFQVVLPDLYRGRVASDAQEAQAMSQALNLEDAAMQDVVGAVLHLKAFGKRAGVMGYCMGGAIAVVAAARCKDVDATVCFYGIPNAELANPAHIQAPFQGHFASRDTWCTPAAVDALQVALDATTTRFEIYRYEADHAFCNETRGPVFHPVHAATAWRRTVGFLWNGLMDAQD
jgi:carboxymethylenebutenolidase